MAKESLNHYQRRKEEAAGDSHINLVESRQKGEGVLGVLEPRGNPLPQPGHCDLQNKRGEPFLEQMFIHIFLLGEDKLSFCSLNDYRDCGYSCSLVFATCKPFKGNL
jgi:hypothetical protein